MGKPREFDILNGSHSIRYRVFDDKAPEYAIREDDEVIHVREVSPSLDALFEEMLGALKELVELMDAIREGDYTPDSFTTQPAVVAIRKAEGREQV